LLNNGKENWWLWKKCIQTKGRKYPK